jgi:hypothetical protein
MAGTTRSTGDELCRYFIWNSRVGSRSSMKLASKEAQDYAGVGACLELLIIDAC